MSTEPPEPPEPTGAVPVPHSALSPEALTGLIDEFVLREGTDYGHAEHDLTSKRAAVRRQLEKGTVRIYFDPTTQSTTLVAELG